MGQAVTCWNQVQSHEDTYDLIDLGVVLKSSDLNHLQRVFKLNASDDQSITEYFAIRLIERYQDRESAEIILESLLLWLLKSMNEIHFVAFLQKILENPDRNQIIYALPSLFLSLECLDSSYQEDAFNLAVFLMTQTGIQLHYFATLFPDEFGDVTPVMEHLDAYMISITNHGSYRVRLCLLNYFARVDNRRKTGSGFFDRIMERFGNTLLNEIFGHLFEKKTEVFAFQYLVDNLPYILCAHEPIQKTLHEIMRYNLLKYPEKFTQFIQAFTPSLRASLGQFSRDSQTQIVENYLKHMALLLKVVSRIDHHNLAKEILITLCSFRDFDHAKHICDQIKGSSSVTRMYRSLLSMMARYPGQERTYIEGLSRFRCRKRGRKPRIDQMELSIFQQVFYLKN